VESKRPAGLLQDTAGNPSSVMETTERPIRSPISPPRRPHSVAARLRAALPRTRLTLSERRLLLAIVDAVLLNGVLLVVLAAREGFSLSVNTVNEAPRYFIILTVLWYVAATLFDCYDLPRTAKATRSAWATGGAALFTALVYLVIPVLTPHFPASRLSSFLFVGMTTLSVPAWRLVYATLINQPTFQQRLLIVGAGNSGAQMARELAHTPQLGNPYAGSGFALVGFVDDDPSKIGTMVEDSPVLGNRHDLVRLVGEHEVDLVVVAITETARLDPELFQALLDCREQGVAMEQVTSLYERVTGRIAVEHAGHDLAIVMPVPDSPTRRLFSASKRVADLIGALGFLVVFGMVAPWLALANRIASPGPLLYRQVRIGKGGRPFELVKFRTMVPDAEKSTGAVWASEGDDRVTRVGEFLRKTRLDELPQCINVLRGEMSLVGPRPERPEFIRELVKQVPYYQARHAVRPGITGWAQVRYRYGSSVEDAHHKLQYDLYYIKHQSIYLELSILVKTAAVMLGFKGR
jgi:exopolysaccharide biosynthesis polyprenyl glycosylphosphotransferase